MWQKIIFLEGVVTWCNKMLVLVVKRNILLTINSLATWENTDYKEERGE